MTPVPLRRVLPVPALLRLGLLVLALVAMGGAASAPDTSSTSKTEATWVVSDPHGPADTVRFETSEGTWMNVDVSPDGATLVFDMLGDLYLLPMSGGEAQRLTSGLAYDMQPRFSPDGKEILFTSDRGGTDNIWIMDRAGTEPRPVTTEADHVVNSGAWSPDGEYVVARKRLTDQSSIGTVELWLYNVHGGSGIQITKKDEIPDANEPVFSPDGRAIYFAARSSRYVYNRNVYEGIWQIRAYDRTTGHIRPLTDGYGGSARPAISPDGRTLSFIRRDRDRTLLMLHDLESGRETVLNTSLDPDMQENFAWTGTYPICAWTPDGDRIVISYGGKLHAVSVSDGAVRDIPFTCRVEQHVTRALRFPQNLAPETIRVHMISWPNISPDGNTLLFSALGRLYRMPVGEEPMALKVDAPRAYCPVFSPEGSEMAYVTWSDAEGGQVWVASASGRGAQRMTKVPGQYANPVFSPDGSRLAFLKGSGAAGRGHDLGDELWFDIQWVPRRGDPRFVISVPNRGSARRMPRLAWSADGERIFYDEDEGAGEKATTVLASIFPDGTDRQVHLKVRQAEEIVPSPDGRWVAYCRTHEGFVAPLPALRGEPLELDGEDGSLPSWKFSAEGADWLSWTADSQDVTWGFGPRFFRVKVADVVAAWSKKKEETAAKAVPTAQRPKTEETKDETKKADEAKVSADTLEVILTAPRARPHGDYAVTGARLITMRGQEVIERGTLVVRDDRILAAGPEGSVEIPADAEVFDMTGKTIIPGLVDVHAHLHYNNLDIIPESLSSYYANLAYGVTTTHDPSASTYAVFTQSEMVEAGVTAGPRIFSTGFILYGADIPNKAPITSLEDARRHVHRLRSLGAFTVKSYMQPRREQRQWIIEAAREESVMVVPEGGGNLEMNMSMILDGHTGIEHALPVAPIYKDVITLLARSQSGYTPTLLVAYGGLSGENWFYQHDEVWKNEKLLRFLPRGAVDARSRRRPVMAPDDDWHHMKVAAGCRAVVEAGGKVQLGAHGQLQGLGAHWELWGLTQGGMSNFDALRCATRSGAEYLGLDGWIGSLEPGKLADFVVLDADPLQDIRNSEAIYRVVKNGEMWDGATMDRVWPTTAPCPRFFWQTQGEMLSTPGMDRKPK